jgi:hypothetical protein
VSELHRCWHALLSALLAAGHVRELLGVLDAAAADVLAAGAGDAAAAHSVRRVVLPLTEAEAQQLVVAAGAALSPAGQAVLQLLVPYVSCQRAGEAALLQGRLLVAHDEPWAGQLLLLVLLRQQMPALASKAAAGGAGDGPRERQQGQQQQQLYHLYWLLLQPVLGVKQGSAAAGEAWAALALLFPHAVSQLCRAADYAGAAALVAAKLRPAHALCTLQGALLALQRYLAVAMEGRLQQQWLAGHGSGSAQPASDDGLWLPRCEAWLAVSAPPAAREAHAQLNSAVRAA